MRSLDDMMTSARMEGARRNERALKTLKQDDQADGFKSGADLLAAAMSSQEPDDFDLDIMLDRMAF